MDVSQWLPVAGAFILSFFLVLAFPRVRRIPNRLLRRLALAAAGLLAFTSLTLAGLILYFDHTYVRYLPILPSPDGKHLAILTYTVGDGSGVDLAEVALRHAWDPYAHRVYTGPVRFQPKAVPPEPEISWLDSTHLLIRFHTLLDGSGNPLPLEQGCAGRAEDVEIRCEETRVHLHLPGR